MKRKLKKNNTCNVNQSINNIRKIHNSKDQYEGSHSSKEQLINTDKKIQNEKKVSNKKTNNKSELNTNLNLAVLNIRSLKEKLNELESCLLELVDKPHIILITESWVKEDEIKFYNLRNYRKKNRGGGIIFFIHESIKFTIIENEDMEKNNLLLINLDEINIKICGCYRSPSTLPQIFFDKLDSILEKNEKIIFAGDFNIDLLKKMKPIQSNMLT